MIKRRMLQTRFVIKSVKKASSGFVIKATGKLFAQCLFV